MYGFPKTLIRTLDHRASQVDRFTLLHGSYFSESVSLFMLSITSFAATKFENSEQSNFLFFFHLQLSFSFSSDLPVSIEKTPSQARESRERNL